MSPADSKAQRVAAGATWRTYLGIIQAQGYPLVYCDMHVHAFDHDTVSDPIRTLFISLAFQSAPSRPVFELMTT